MLTNLERIFCTYGVKREDMTNMMRMSCCLRCWQNHTRRLQTEGAWNTDQFKGGGGIWGMGGSTGEEKKERCKWTAGEGSRLIFRRRSGKGEFSSAGEFSTRCKFSAGD